MGTWMLMFSVVFENVCDSKQNCKALKPSKDSELGQVTKDFEMQLQILNAGIYQ